MGKGSRSKVRRAGDRCRKYKSRNREGKPVPNRKVRRIKAGSDSGMAFMPLDQVKRLPADISSSGRRMYVNGNYHDFFTVDPTAVVYTDLNYFSDDWHEIVAVGLVSKKAYITLARVRGSEVAVTKRVRVKIKKKHTSASITTDISKQKFLTRFSAGKKYTWKVSSSGSFSRSK